MMRSKQPAPYALEKGKRVLITRHCGDPVLALATSTGVVWRDGDRVNVVIERLWGDKRHLKVGEDRDLIIECDPHNDEWEPAPEGDELTRMIAVYTLLGGKE